MKQVEMQNRKQWENQQEIKNWLLRKNETYIQKLCVNFKNKKKKRQNL